MAVRYTEDYTIITCDKCGHEQKELKEDSNDRFFKDGWSLSSSARKYKNRCYKCLTGKEKKAMNFVKEKFGL